MKFFIWIAASMVLVSCGADNSGDSDSDQGQEASEPQRRSLFVQDAASLPACDAAAEGWLVYLKDVGLKACQAGAWIDVETKGDRGDKGDKGDPGETSLKIAAQYSCDWSENLDTRTSYVRSMRAEFTQFSDGSWHSLCVSHHTVLPEDAIEARGGKFHPKGSANVRNGTLVCSTIYGEASFTISSKNTAYNNSSDENDSPNSIACEESYKDGAIYGFR